MRAARLATFGEGTWGVETGCDRAPGYARGRVTAGQAERD